MISRLHLRSLVALVLVTSADAGAQSIEQRVRAVRDGTVELRYAPRPGVCGDGSHYWSIGRGMRVSRGTVQNGMSTNAPCLPGPVHVRLRTENGEGRVVSVEVGPTPRRSAGEVTDLGTVPAAAAADYFLDLASSGSGSSASRAVTAAALADSASVWRRLLDIAGDSTTRAKSTRNEASFWLALFTAAKLEGRDESLALETDDDDERDDAKSSAIFALSQLRNREGIDPLVRIARSNKEARLRRKALFWLGQSGDPRAIALFGEILRR